MRKALSFFSNKCLNILVRLKTFFFCSEFGLSMSAAGRWTGRTVERHSFIFAFRQLIIFYFFFCSWKPYKIICSVRREGCEKFINEEKEANNEFGWISWGSQHKRIDAHGMHSVGNLNVLIFWKMAHRSSFHALEIRTDVRDFIYCALMWVNKLRCRRTWSNRLPYIQLFAHIFHLYVFHYIYNNALTVWFCA